MTLHTRYTWFQGGFSFALVNCFRKMLHLVTFRFFRANMFSKEASHPLFFVINSLTNTRYTSCNLSLTRMKRYSFRMLARSTDIFNSGGKFISADLFHLRIIFYLLHLIILLKTWLHYFISHAFCSGGALLIDCLPTTITSWPTKLIIFIQWALPVDDFCAVDFGGF